MSVEEWTSRVSEARKKNMAPGSLVAPKKKDDTAGNALSAYRIKQLSESEVVLESANLGGPTVKKTMSTKEFLLNWKLSSERISTKLEGWSTPAATDHWTRVGIHSKVCFKMKQIT